LSDPLREMPPPRRRANAKQDAKRKAERSQAAAAKGAEIKNAHAEEMAVHLKTFQEQLEAFAATHKKQIQTDPQFRAQFNRMCRDVGVDPLQCASDAHSVSCMGSYLPCVSSTRCASLMPALCVRTAKKGFWASALGHGDFYYELGTQCIKVCISTRSQNGV
jgi:ESCRT-II complex subunit VPS22